MVKNNSLEQVNKLFVQKINWAFLFFYLILHLIVILSVFTLWFTHAIQWQTYWLTFAFYVLTGFSITAGYHRLFSHRSYIASTTLKAILLFFASGALQYSALRWVITHRLHHAYVDSELDPHNSKRGFFYAHMGWIFYYWNSDNEKLISVFDLQKDKLVLFQDRYYWPLALFVGLFLPTLIASAWGDAIGGFFVAGLFRILFVNQFIYFVNSWAHYAGNRPYDKNSSARDSLWVALFTLGEGFHNYHHAFPFDYRNGVKWFQWDPTKWLIWSLSKVRLAKYLRKASDLEIKNALKKLKQYP